MLNSNYSSKEAVQVSQEGGILFHNCSSVDIEEGITVSDNEIILVDCWSSNPVKIGEVQRIIL